MRSWRLRQMEITLWPALVPLAVAVACIAVLLIADRLSRVVAIRRTQRALQRTLDGPPPHAAQSSPAPALTSNRMNRD